LAGSIYAENVRHHQDLGRQHEHFVARWTAVPDSTLQPASLQIWDAETVALI
jgi:hypothetical protein